MPPLKVVANELTNVQVSHVSLVKRGAIRVPFRFLKSNDGDGDMIDLNIFKKKETKPMVAAVLVNKAANLDVAKARITKAGFQVEKFDDSNDGVIIFPQTEELGDFEPGKDGVYILKMDEMLSCVVTGITKSFESINFDSSSFDEVLAQEGLRPGVFLSMDVLGATVSNIMAKAEDKTAMVSDLETALAEFSKHIVSMAQAVPEDAFSVDFFKAEDFQDAAGDGDPAGEGAGEGNADDAAAAAQAAADKATADAAAGEGDGGTGEANAAAQAGDTDAGAVGEIVKQMAGLAKGVDALIAQGKATTAKLDAHGKRIDETAALAKSAKDAISNTVRGGADLDPDVTEPVLKTAGAYTDPPLIDTGMHKLN